MATDQTFSQFATGGLMKVGDQPVGLRDGVYTTFDFPGTGIKDFNGNIMVEWSTSGMLVANWPRLINALPGGAVIYTAGGNDLNIPIEIRPAGTAGLKLDDIYWPTSPGIVGQALYQKTADTLGFTPIPPATFITGTANQVLANGTSGTPITGSVTLTTPQDIATTSSPTFAALTLTAPLSMASGGSSKALVANNGGIVYTDADSMEVLPGTPVAGQMLQSSASSAPSWSTTAWPNTVSANQILYASANNTIAGIIPNTNSVLVTNSAGVPGFGPSMASGQVIIGSSLGQPMAAYITPGNGINISNSANAITISAKTSGLNWTTVSGTSQTMVGDSGYVVTNASLTTLLLPVIAPLGTVIVVMGSGAGGWQIQQNVSQSIQIGTMSSTVGTAGSVSSTNRYNTLRLVCIVANTTFSTEGAPQSAGLNVL